MSMVIRPKENDMRERIIETAQRLFRQLGFRKTTVADIARELEMSPANVYRFFGSKTEINDAVARQLMGEVESAMEAIAAGESCASARLRALVHTVNAMNGERYTDDRKLHEMVAIALSENWPIVKEHIERMGTIYGKVIDDGIAAGEFAPCDVEGTAKIVQAATARFCHPRLMIECASSSGPSLDEMVDFCLAGLSPSP